MSVEEALEKYIGEPAMLMGVMMMLILMLPVWLPVELAVLIGKGASAGYGRWMRSRRVRPQLGSYQAELERTIRARNEAIQNILTIEREAERQMREVMDARLGRTRVIQGRLP